MITNKMLSDTTNANLPLEKLPPEWQEKERLDVLFGPVRKKNVNSFDWDSKLKFWKDSIEVYSKEKKVYVFTISRLERSFLHDCVTPACLKDVLEDLICSGDVILLSDFLKKPETTWSGWATNVLVKRPLSWTFNKVKSSIITVNVSNLEYVHINVVQQEANKLMKKIPDELQNKVWEIKEFARSMDFDEIESLKILLHQLANEDKVSLRDCRQDGQQMILLRFSTVSKPIEDIDEQIYIFTKQEAMLQSKIESEEKRIAELRDEVKNYLKGGQRRLAKMVLTKMKLKEKSVEALAKSANNVSTLLHNLENSAYNKEVFKTYNIAIDNLKSEQLNIDDIDETMAQLNELVISNDELQSTLGKELDEISDDSLEEELAALMKETETEKSEESEINLPSPPTSADAQRTTEDNLTIVTERNCLVVE